MIGNFEIEFVMKSIKNTKDCATDGIAGDQLNIIENVCFFGYYK